MSQMNPNNVAASCTFTWVDDVLSVLKNDGFKAPIDLSAVATFAVGDVALIPNDVNGDISNARYYLVAFCGTRPTFTNGPPPTITVVRLATAQIMDAAASPDTDGRRWVLAGGLLWTTNNVAGVISTNVPARNLVTVELRSYGNLLAVSRPSSALLLYLSGKIVTIPCQASNHMECLATIPR